MYNEVVKAQLEYCIEHIEAIERYTTGITNADHFINQHEGLTYDGTLIRLQALTEILKKIAQKSPLVIKELNYDGIQDVIKFRDYVSHHYEQLSHELVFSIVQTNIPVLKKCITRLLSQKFN